jgi:very-short-patch-repair endonuclease
VARLTREEQGVDTLFLALGFLEFFEADGSQDLRRAPLLLVPATLERHGLDGWKVRARDDDPLVNPALVEYLREQHDLALPLLPESLDAFEPLAWYRDVQKLVAGSPRWRVTADAMVGILSFQKFVMHEDLKRNAAVLAGHEVIQQLAARSGTGAGTPQLPPAVAGLVLDEMCAPEDSVQVVDADSTQLRALAAVTRGHHLVIEGPPGTGKSQTITNLIAATLAAGKTVLFVAEKQAALNVVFDRLKKAGLGDFCLELHSSKASKGAVVKELARTLDATLNPPPAPEFDRARLAAVRRELTGYVEAIHRRIDPLGRTIYATIGRLTDLADAPALRVPLTVDGVTAETLAQTTDVLTQLAAAATRLKDPAAHPWRDVAKSTFDLGTREVVEATLATLADALAWIAQRLPASRTTHGVPADPTLAQLERLADVANAIDASPGVEVSVAGDPAWDAYDSAAKGLVERGRAMAAAERRAEERLGTRAVDAALSSAGAEVRRRGGGLFAWLSGTWRAARTALKARVPAAHWAGAKAAAAEVEAAERAAAERQRLAAEPAGTARFGRHWRGPDSDWDALDALAAWLVRFRAAARAAGLGAEAAAAVDTARPSPQPLRDLAQRSAAARAAWRTLAGAVAWPAGYGEDLALAALTERVRAMRADPAGWRDWGAFYDLGTRARASVAAPVVAEAAAARLPWADLPRAFERRFLEHWLSAHVDADPALQRFGGASHEEKIAAFRDLDREVLLHHRAVLSVLLRRQSQERLRDPSIDVDLRFLRNELAKQKGHKPVRQLLQSATGAVRAIKPCFLMSPMTVAFCLDPERHRFDLVVFDEASQMTPEDALGSVARGRQVVVVGDPKQLPPTSFFAVQSGQEEPEVAADGQPTYSDLDSVLELALASGFAGARLRWHYRSRHESLISYSNKNFYDSSLFTFPSAERDRSVVGLTFEHVKDGRYEGKGVNRAEAQRVVDRVLAHAREHPTRSLCVGTFSLPQQLAIQDELELRRRTEPGLDDFLALDVPEPFFVKNLESIQGDERDVVILSVTYGPGADGVVRHNFGPINGQNGWRRLNVLTTRARERMLVVSSMRADDIDLTRAPSQGAALLRSFLDYAETGRLDGGPVVGAAAAAESPLEAEVAGALARAGITVQPQVGVAGYRLDLGVLDADIPGRFVCGIECDGVAYHSAESARDRDRLRESVLRGLGWRLHRVWSIDWWHDAAGQTKRLLAAIEASRIEARVAKPAIGAGANAALSRPEGSPAPSAGPVARPGTKPVVFAPYKLARLRPRTQGILESSPHAVARTMLEILEQEGPLHEDDLETRTLGAFGHTRAGKNIRRHVDAAFRALGDQREVEQADGSWRLAAAAVKPRTRATVAVPAERIPVWEIDAAVLEALAKNRSLPEDEVVSVVRDGFGYGAASARLRTSVKASIERLLAERRLGIGSNGVARLDALPGSSPGS